MARDEFDNAGEFVKIEELLGKPVLFTPIEYIEGMTTAFGENKDAVRADIVDLDTGDEYMDQLVFQGKLIATLKRRITKSPVKIDRDPVTGVFTESVITTVKRVLGVLSKGEAQRGQNAPYILTPASDAQKDLARAYQAENPTPDPVTTVVRQYVHDATGNTTGNTPMQNPAAATQVENPATKTPSTPDSDPWAASEDPWAADK
jgi:hypothetical protein